MRRGGRQLVMGVAVVFLGGCEFLFPFTSTVEPVDSTSSSSSSGGGSSLGGSSSGGGSSGVMTSSSAGSSTMVSSVGMSSSVGVSSSRASSSVGSTSNPGSSSTSGVMSSSMAPMPPTGVTDTYLSPEDVVLTKNAAEGVLANDIGVGTITATVGTMPTHGALVFNANGSFTYTPDANYNGPDSFTYTPAIGGLVGGTTTVNIGISAVNDPPVATADSYTVLKNTAFAPPAPGVLANDVDPDTGDATPDVITAIVGTQPAHGTLALNANGGFTFTPTTDYVGPDSFTYTARDVAMVTSTPVTVTLTINETNVPPVAVNDSYTTAEDVTLTVPAIMGVLLNDTDAENGNLTALLVNNVATGTLTLNAGGDFEYVPVPGASGVVTFTYNASDGLATSAAPATVTITVTPVNDPPVAVNDTYPATEDTVLTVNVATGVLANDTDEENGTLTAAVVSQPTKGVLALNANGSFTYTPNADQNGLDTFTYQASDPGTALSMVATVTINIAPANDLPVATADAFSGNEDTMITGNVLTNDTDVDGDMLTASLVADVATGTLTLNPNGSFTYTPAANATGDVTFTYRANDGTGNSNTVTVTLTLTAVNDPPVGAVDSYNTVAGVTLTVVAPGVLSNDTDVESQGTITAVAGATTPTKGLVTLNANGSFTYNTTDAFQTGTDTFSYRVDDGTAQSAETLVTITITPQQRFHTTLTGSQQVPAVATAATGTAVCLLNPVALTVTCTGTHDAPDVTASHIHAGAILQNGAPVGTGTITATGGPITGTVTLSAGEVTQLQAGGMYLNIHTTAFGGGEIRGQLLKDGESLFEVIFTAVSGGNGRLSIIHRATEVQWAGSTTATPGIVAATTGLYLNDTDLLPTLVIPYTGDPNATTSGTAAGALALDNTWRAKVFFNVSVDVLNDPLVLTIPAS